VPAGAGLERLCLSMADGLQLSDTTKCVSHLGPAGARRSEGTRPRRAPDNRGVSRNRAARLTDNRCGRGTHAGITSGRSPPRWNGGGVGSHATPLNAPTGP
jgi:hypothetical protein